MSPASRLVTSVLTAALLLWILPAVASACSPPFEPTIKALGPDQVVVVGSTGERVPGGRIFNVSRWFNGGVPVTPILIEFKEGESTGDCSYPVAAGTTLIIAPYREADGKLHADLGTLQADPNSEQGQQYIAEATSLFGPGVVPPTGPEAPAGAFALEVGHVVLAIAIVVALLLGMLGLFGRERRRSA